MRFTSWGGYLVVFLYSGFVMKRKHNPNAPMLRWSVIQRVTRTPKKKQPWSFTSSDTWPPAKQTGIPIWATPGCHGECRQSSRCFISGTSTCSAQLNNHLVGAENKNNIRRLAVASSYYDPSGLGQLRISKHWALVFLNLRSSWPRKGLTPPKERSGTR